MIDFLRLISAVVWMLVVVWTSRSIIAPKVRTAESDQRWLISCGFGILQLGYFLRWVFRQPRPSEGALDDGSAIGLQCLSIVLGVLILLRRYDREGFRW